jgi:hypothetical protein
MYRLGMTTDLPSEVPVPQGQPVSAQVLINELRRVLGVDEVEVEADPSGGPGLVRMVLLPEADEAAVASAVDEVLRRRYGLGVDPSRIEVIEESTPESAGHSAYLPVGAGAGHATARRRSGRPALRKVIVGADGTYVRVEVWLEHLGLTFAGTAEGESAALQRTIAIAALDAVRQVLGSDAVVRVDLADVEISAASGGEVALVQVVMAAPDGAERLTGAATVRDDADQAVVRATLDAVNRRLQPLLDEQGRLLAG